MRKPVYDTDISVEITPREWVRESNGVITAEVSLPSLVCDRHNRAAKRINSYYTKLDNGLRRMCGKRLTRHNINGAAPRRVTATAVQTLHSHALLSLLIDFQYQDDGNHGAVKTGDTWSLASGRQLKLRQLFTKNRHIKSRITDTILNDMNVSQSRRRAVKRRLKTAVDLKKYYLTGSALHVYADGYHDFAVPYDKLPAMRYAPAQGVAAR